MLSILFTDDCNTHEGFEDASTTLHPLATTMEKYLWGLLKGPEYSRQNVVVEEVESRGRSAFASKDFKAGDFVCEYRGVVRKKQGEYWGDHRNASLGIMCYCLDATYDNVTYVFDAAASINDPGRYINHARKNYNLVKMQPAMIGKPPAIIGELPKPEQFKIGFVAEISNMGRSNFLTGLRNDPDIPWINTDAKQIATTLQNLRAKRARYMLTACRYWRC